MSLKRARKVVVLGAGGQLGRQLLLALGRSGAWEAVGYRHSEMDVSDSAARRECVRLERPDLLINCAALTHVDACETDPRTFDVNSRPLEVMAKACNEAGACLVLPSTDYVFDGNASRPYREDDPPGPLSRYGQSKLEAEILARSCERHLIVRTAWLFGPFSRNFVDAILARAEAGQPLRVTDDQFGSPSYAPDVAECIERLVAREIKGTIHIANSGQASRYELAREALRQAGLSVSVTPIRSTEYVLPAPRPAYSVLNCEKYTALTGHTPRDWRIALRDYLDHRER